MPFIGRREDAKRHLSSQPVAEALVSTSREKVGGMDVGGCLYTQLGTFDPACTPVPKPTRKFTSLLLCYLKNC